MKAFVLCVCALIYVSFISAGPILQRLRTSPTKTEVDECLDQVGIMRSEGYHVDEILHDIQDQPGMEEKRRKHGCVIECLLKKANWMEGTELREDRIYGNVTKLLENHPTLGKVQKLVRDCAVAVRNTTPNRCEKGVTVMVCITKGVKDWGHLLPIPDIHENEEED